MKPSEELDKILQSLKELREADERQREADERQREADARRREEIEKENQRAREAEEQLRRELKEENQRAREAEEELRKALKEANEELRKALKEADERLGKQILALTGTVGNYHGEALEAIAAAHVMKRLELEERLEFLEMLQAGYFRVNGALREFDLYGRARRGPERFLVVGEVKRSVDEWDVLRFAAHSDPLLRRRNGRVLRVIYCSFIEAKALREARRRGIRVYLHRRRARAS